MKVHLYTVCWNEADLLPHFFRHYDGWVDRYVIHDNGSTDDSPAILRRHPRVEVRPFPWSDLDSFVRSHLRLYDEVWKESRGVADWVVITSIDEHLHLPGMPMRWYLRWCGWRGVTAVPALGYQMLSADLPPSGRRLCETCSSGAPHAGVSKLGIFRPDCVADTGFTVGRHAAKPRGRVVYPSRDRLLNLHYKFMGFARTLARHEAQREGLRPADVANQWGVQYWWPEERLREEWERFAADAVDLASGGHAPWRDHAEPRWWRAAA